MPYNQRFEVRCDEEWRAVLRRVAKRMQMSETEAVRESVSMIDDCGAVRPEDFVGYNLDPEQKEPA